MSNYILDLAMDAEKEVKDSDGIPEILNKNYKT